MAAAGGVSTCCEWGRMLAILWRMLSCRRRARALGCQDFCERGKGLGIGGWIARICRRGGGRGERRVAVGLGIAMPPRPGGPRSGLPYPVGLKGWMDSLISNSFTRKPLRFQAIAMIDHSIGCCSHPCR